MKETFENINLSSSSLLRLEQIGAILDEYQADGYDLSLRQLYYQLVARGIIENSQRSYKRLGELVKKGRRAGLIDWDVIVDRGRQRIENPHWRSPGEIVSAAASQFRIDKWANQPWHVEVMVEKQALEGVLIPVCSELDVPFTANKGYSSDSMMYRIGKRIRRYLYDGKSVLVVYLGDHDPSGIDMTRDIAERLAMFASVLEDDIEMARVALNMDQVETLRPPENPAKITDSRYKAYVMQFGTSSWELDAVEPRQLAALVTQAVVSVRDEDAWNEAIRRETEMRQELQAFAARWESE